jgi:uncharacterized protein (UPF0335 family)
MSALVATIDLAGQLHRIIDRIEDRIAASPITALEETVGEIFAELEDGTPLERAVARVLRQEWNP